MSLPDVPFPPHEERRARLVMIATAIAKFHHVYVGRPPTHWGGYPIRLMTQQELACAIWAGERMCRLDGIEIEK